MAVCAIVLRLEGEGATLATSKCGHCGEGLFELKNDFNAGVMLQLQEKKIDDIAELVGRIDAGLRAVEQALNRL
jgi:hypothetical protein